MKTSPRLRLSLLLCFALSLPLSAQEAVSPKEPARPGSNDELPLDEIRTFTEVFAKVKNDYVEDVDDRTLLENAIRGMLEGLDPHSAYLDPDAYAELQEGTSGEFGGLGIEVGLEDGFIKVIAPIDDTPAQRAGVRAGDLIIRLDDTPVKGMSLNDAVEMMRGKPGTSITLTIAREGLEKPLTLTITRDIIKVRSVRSRMLEPGFGYLRISQFQAHTADDVSREVENLKREAGNSLKGVVIDLRNNPGGILSAAVAVSDLFLDEGLIVYTEGRVKDARLRFTARPSDILEDVPLVVLVNAGSASASEIVAGALQDHKRAIIMGQKTFGKGSVQTILPMANEAALKLTTARYFTPSGRSIQAAGIVPDIFVDQYTVQKREDLGDVVTEANLSRHLTNGTEEAEEGAETTPAAGPEGDDDVPDLARTDYALHEALTVLKGLAILRKNDTG